MANSVFIGWLGGIPISGNGTTLTIQGSLAVTGQTLFSDGLAGAPSAAFISQPSTGLFLQALNVVRMSIGGTAVHYWGADSFRILADGASLVMGSSADVMLSRIAPNTFGQSNGANAQAFRPYGYQSGSRAGYGAVQTALASVTLSGASTATGNIIPAGAFVIGVATTTTTAITGASGYQVGDGSDADRYGDITGTAVGTNSDNTDATADPTGYNASASAITLTAKTSDFTGGVVQVVVFYLTTGAS